MKCGGHYVWSPIRMAIVLRPCSAEPTAEDRQRTRKVVHNTPRPVGPYPFAWPHQHYLDT